MRPATVAVRRFATARRVIGWATKLKGMPSPPHAVPGAAAGGAPRAVSTPRAALAELLAGNRRFISGQPVHGHDVTAAAASASGDQQPYAVVLGCIDSRVPLEAIFDQTFGSICVIRSGAHVLDRAVSGSIEYVVGELGVPLVMVLGHERCGAVASAVRALRTGEHPGGSLAYLVDRIAPAVAEVGVDDPQAHPLAIRRHVVRTVAVRAPTTCSPARSRRAGWPWLCDVRPRHRRGHSVELELSPSRRTGTPSAPAGERTARRVVLTAFCVAVGAQPSKTPASTSASRWRPSRRPGGWRRGC
jgi:carbonic anhydrase